MRGRNAYGPGFWKAGQGIGRRYAGRGNPYPYCRFYPERPRGWWAMPEYDGMKSENEVEYLKDTANDLKNELDNINKRISELENK